MLSFVDKRLNNVTMYRLILYVLGAMSLVGVALDPSRIGSLACLLLVGYGANKLFARVMGAAENAESSAVTSLILFLILFPAETVADYSFLIFAAVLAMASKYLVTWHRRHLFNPAAFAALVVGALGWGAGWWVGSAYMLPIVLVGGVLVARKTRRLPVSFVFALAAFASLYVSARWFGSDVSAAAVLREGFLSWPIVFFATIMLTEPLTLPASRTWQYAEAALVGLLFAVPYQIGPFHSSPELALLIGNLFALADGVKRTYRLRLVEKTEIAPGVFDFAFASDMPMRFSPGQYLEWTLPHAHSDQRGNRRTFTVASSPSEPHVHLGVRIPEQPSTFKRALAGMRPGDVMAGSNLGGEFVLPNDPAKKLAFVAGGIGVTPFRSMARYFLDRGTRVDAVLFYACKTPADFAYADLFDRAATVGLRAVYLATERDGFLTEDKIKKDAPDFLERRFYLSGPSAMVESYRRLLRGMGVSAADIRTDYFPGY